MAFVLSRAAGAAGLRRLAAAGPGAGLAPSACRRSRSVLMASTAAMAAAARGVGTDSRVVCITSGKGGVGKTTTAASIGMGLAMKGHKTCVIDFDIGLRNLDIHLVRRGSIEMERAVVGGARGALLALRDRPSQ